VISLSSKTFGVLVTAVQQDLVLMVRGTFHQVEMVSKAMIIINNISAAMRYLS
jgi:hypothetical protein